MRVHWNLPNKLTMGRIAAIPLMVVCFYLPAPYGYWIPCILFFFMGVTDWIDGYLARRDGMVSDFGKFLDPVADKLVVAVALILLVADGRANPILVAIIIGREIAISALREVTAGQGGVPVSWWGKWKTAFQMLAIGALLLHVDLGLVNAHTVGVICLWIAAILTLVSGYQYMAATFQDPESESTEESSNR